MGRETASPFYKDATTVLWVALRVLMAGLLVRTLVAVGRGEICVPDAAAQGLASAADAPAAVEESDVPAEARGPATVAMSAGAGTS